jgi:subtilisin-like proprotein convertase family protein
LWSNGQVSSTAVNLVAGSYTVTVTDGNGCSAFAFVQITEATRLTAQIVNVINTSCDGASVGSATVVAAGGTTPYSYQWPASANNQVVGTATGLSAGLYVVTISDANNCITSTSLTIGSEGELGISKINDIGPLCMSSQSPSILLSAVPANPDVTFTWSGGASIGIPDGTSTGLNAAIPSFTTANSFGTALITVTASLDGCIGTTSFTVTIQDTQNPEFVNCPPAGTVYTVSLYSDDCEAGAIWAIPVAEDNCGVTVSQTAGPIQGAILVVGTYPIVYTAADEAGNSVTCTFAIDVVDTEAPVIVCPGNVVIDRTDAGACTWTSPVGSLRPLVAVSNCPAEITWSVVNPGNSVVTGTADVSGYVFGIGVSQVTYTIRDIASGQTLSCSFTVTVVDEEAPSITCPSNLLLECGNNQNTALTQAWINSVLAFDNCDNNLSVTATVFSENNRCGNSLTILYQFTATDQTGNRTSCFSSVLINDTKAPVITGGADSGSEECSDVPAGNYPEFDFWLTNHAGATATDACSGLITWTNNYHPNKWVTQCGNTRYVDVIFSATDDCGNVSSTTHRFSIGDTTPPQFTNCERPAIIADAPLGWCNAFVNFSPVQATDNCGNVTLTQIDNTGLGSGSLFPVGLQILIYEATDQCGNKNTCELKVVVNDYKLPPAFTCPQSLTISTDPSSCEAIVSNIGTGTVSDNCSENTSVVYRISKPDGSVVSGFTNASGNAFNKGINQVLYRAQDQPILLITEVIHDGVTAGIEITNFGPASYDISDLNISKAGFNPALSETFNVPNGTILGVGDVYTHTFTAVPAGTPLGFYIWFMNNVLDGVSLNGFTPSQYTWSGQLNGNHVIRTQVYDTDAASDFMIATPCETDVLGTFNTGLPLLPDNGKKTSLQSELTSQASCTFQVNVLDDELPYCAAFKTVEVNGASAAIKDGQCIRSVVQITESFAVSDINVKNLQGVFANMGALTVALVSPSGTRVTLFDRLCNGTADFNVNFDDQSSQTLPSIVCSPLGKGMTYQPLESMNQFLNEPALGDWTLEVYTNSTVTGTLTGWILQLSSLQPYDQIDVVLDNEAGKCSASYSWIHARVGDNCNFGTISVNYQRFDGVPVPLGGVLSGMGGYPVTATFNAGVTTIIYTITDLSGNVSECSFDVEVRDIEKPLILSGCNNIVLNLEPGECRTPYTYVSLLAKDNCGDYTVSYNPAPGYLFELGNTVVTATVTDEAGNTTTCSFVVAVVENTPVSNVLACNDEINLSLGKDCIVWLNADMLLEGDDYRCYENYCLIIRDLAGNIVGSSALNTHFFDLDDVGKSYYVSVCLSCSNPNANCCWTRVNVEEKLLPEVTCPSDVTIQCNESEDPSATGWPVLLSCEVGIDITYKDSYLNGDECGNPRATINRTWTIRDVSGNQVVCNQIIYVMPFNPQLMQFPADLVRNNALDCAEVGKNPNLIKPENTGYPTINGQSLFNQHLCELNFGYTDEILKDANCLNSYEILRHWTVRDECRPLVPGVNPLRHIQAIKVNDKTPPVFVYCPADITIGTLDHKCSGEYLLEDVPSMIDEVCGEIDKIYISVTRGSVSGNYQGAGNYLLFNLGTGYHDVKIRVTDKCRNVAECTFSIFVEDRTLPSVVARGDLVISLIDHPSGGYAKLPVSSVDNGSHDNCGPVKLELRRVNSITQCGNKGADGEYNNNLSFNNGNPQLHENDDVRDTDGGAFVTFCCADLFTGDDVDGDGIIDTAHHKVILRVWDDADGDGIFGSAGDNFNEGWTIVRVDNKIPPVLTCPVPVTISCDQNVATSSILRSTAGFDFNLTGGAVAKGICGNVDVQFIDALQLNQCGIGVIKRTFSVPGQSGSCIQQITLSSGINTPAWEVQPPALSVVQVGCNGPSESELKQYGPSWTGGPCDQIAVNSEVDEFIASAGECKKWVVKYNLVNWCNNDFKGPYYRYFAYKDSVAPQIQHCRDTIFNAEANCEVKLLRLVNKATDNAGCAATASISWSAVLDLNEDGTPDFEWSSYLAPGDDVSDALAGNFASITDDNGNGIPDIYISPSLADAEASLVIPVTLYGGSINHKITWTARDGCNNKSDCSYRFQVNDVKAPTPVCLSISTAFMADPDGSGPAQAMAEVKASVSIKEATDNCTKSENLLFTYDQTGPQVAGKTVFGKVANINVPHLFDNSGALVVYPVDVNDAAQRQILEKYLRGEEMTAGRGVIQRWDPAQKSSFRVWTTSVLPAGSNVGETDIVVTVWDERFNSDYCTTRLRLVCSTCPGALVSTVSGRAATEYNQGVKDVEVVVQSTMPEFPRSLKTPQDGNYSFSLVNGVDYSFSAEKTGNYIDGVTTLDMILIQRHILGLQSLDSPWKVIAADANNSGKVSASDITEIRKLILGIYNVLPNTNSWRFPVKNQSLDALDPFPYKEASDIDSLAGNVSGLDFVAVKIGDVNGSASVGLTHGLTEPRSSAQLKFTVKDRAVQAGETVEIPVYASGISSLSGFQFTLEVQKGEFVELKPSALDMQVSDYAILDGDRMTVSYAPRSPFTVQSDVPAFILRVRATSDAMLSELVALKSTITRAEAYDAQYNVARVGWKVESDGNTDPVLYQNEPNPFRSQTQIQFLLPAAGKAGLNVYDATGKLLWSRDVEGVQGMNTLILSREDVGAAGVCYYTLEFGEFTATRKMILIE